MVNSIRKGKTFERDVANFLTIITGVKWHRVPCSGGFQTSHNTENPVFSGDVFTEDKIYKDIVIECKSHKNLAICDFFNSESKLYNWIKQTINESKGNIWILFFKINGIGTFIICDYPLTLGDIGKSIISHKKYDLNVSLEIDERRLDCYFLKNLSKI